MLLIPERELAESQTLDLARRAKELEEANSILLREISAREKIEGEIRLAQKLEAIGQLAAGIAHEINTPMQYIGDSIHFLRRSFDDLLKQLDMHEQSGLEPQISAQLRNRVPRAFDRTIEGIERVSSIVRAMKEFAHPSSDEKTPLNINGTLDTVLMVSRNEYKYVAEAITDFGPIPQVPCRAGEMNQVFLNLIVNAAQAIGEAVHGTNRQGLIHVRTALDEGDKNTVLVQIKDTGTGIPESIRDRVFEPFFTTKPPGKGTGQGLAISRSIVDKHGGTLTFESVEGRGTTFSVRLPLHEKAAA